MVMGGAGLGVGTCLWVGGWVGGGEGLFLADLINKLPATALPSQALLSTYLCLLSRSQALLPGVPHCTI